MAAIQCGLISGVGMNCGHDTAFNANRFIQNFGQWREAIRGAGSVGHNGIFRNQVAMINPEYDRTVDVLCWRGNQDPAGAPVDMRLCLSTIIVLAGALEQFAIDVTGRVCADVGACTGGSLRSACSCNERKGSPAVRLLLLSCSFF